MSVRLYVGNLPKEDVNRDELHSIFADAGDVSTKVIKDRKTGKCRGFAFVTVPTDELADEIIEKYNGHPFNESTLKIEKALPRSKNQEEEEARPATTTTSSAPVRRSSGKKPKRGGSSSSTSSSSSDSGSIQPDPRWAADLAKLKDLLSTQATNS